jgi:Protein of unknown function (DUF3833)
MGGVQAMRDGATELSRPLPLEAALAPDHEAFDPLEFFAGPVSAQGIFEDPFGRIKRRFKITMFGTATASGSLDVTEMLTFDDGSIDTRQWTLTRLAPDRFTMAGPDIVGLPVGVIAHGSAEIKYVYRLTVGGRIIHVRLRDRLHRIDSRHVVNRGTMRKFGIHLGDLSASFLRA